MAMFDNKVSFEFDQGELLELEDIVKGRSAGMVMMGLTDSNVYANVVMNKDQMLALAAELQRRAELL